MRYPINRYSFVTGAGKYLCSSAGARFVVPALRSTSATFQLVRSLRAKSRARLRERRNAR